MSAIALPASRADVTAIAARLRREPDVGRAIAIALTLRDACASVARVNTAESGILDYASGYFAGLADVLEETTFGPSPSDALH